MNHWISIEERVAYCLGGAEPVDTIFPDNRTYFISQDNILEESARYQAYRKSIRRLLAQSARSGHWFRLGDFAYTEGNGPVVVKVRDSWNPDSKGVIFNLKEHRHFPDLRDILPQDPPWTEKKNEVVWRGMSTAPPNGKNRADFVSAYGGTYDVGFASKNPKNEPKKGPGWKDALSMDEMLKYKYLPVLDGNDKATSLVWVLASGSVPIMVRPRFHSWACEPWLKPGVHYLEMQPDFSDFADQIEYLKSHEDHAQEIAQNGWAFASQFYDLRRELAVEREVIHRLDALCG